MFVLKPLVSCYHNLWNSSISDLVVGVFSCLIIHWALDPMIVFVQLLTLAVRKRFNFFSILKSGVRCYTIMALALLDGSISITHGIFKHPICCRRTNIM